MIALHDEPAQGRPLLEQLMAGGKRLPAGTRTLQQIADHARRAIELDPDYEKGYGCLLTAYVSMVDFLPAEKRKVIHEEVAEMVADLERHLPGSDAARVASYVASKLSDEQLAIVMRAANQIRC